MAGADAELRDYLEHPATLREGWSRDFSLGAATLLISPTQPVDLVPTPVPPLVPVLETFCQTGLERNEVKDGDRLYARPSPREHSSKPQPQEHASSAFSWERGLACPGNKGVT